MGIDVKRSVQKILNTCPWPTVEEFHKRREKMQNPMEAGVSDILLESDQLKVWTSCCSLLKTTRREGVSFKDKDLFSDVRMFNVEKKIGERLLACETPHYRVVFSEGARFLNGCEYPQYSIAVTDLKKQVFCYITRESESGERETKGSEAYLQKALHQIKDYPVELVKQVELPYGLLQQKGYTHAC